MTNNMRIQELPPKWVGAFLTIRRHVEKKRLSLTGHDRRSHPSSKDSTKPSANPLEGEEWASMVGISGVLMEVAERLQRKAHVRLLTAGWDKRIGIVAVDTRLRWQMTFVKGSASCGEWKEDVPADLILHGNEKEIHMLLAGDALQYASVRQRVRFVGTLRDQLKLDAILRLTSK
ncbi:hypothetical protein P9761_09445 [Brevibacillus centrosporus]|uniref:hypothetical protein n=1 Tax=Brevibacillus centrosporus TaxID=54910 RepID=UPI001FEA790E|nr:hypothetical protein [Brevibacillus centrosporus]MED4908436.1 hypothetical protein [Brevibacillus centrosporus]